MYWKITYGSLSEHVPNVGVNSMSPNVGQVLAYICLYVLDITSLAQLIHLTSILYSLEQLEFTDSSFCQKIILAFSARNLEGRPFVCEMFLQGRDREQHCPGQEDHAACEVESCVIVPYAVI